VLQDDGLIVLLVMGGVQQGCRRVVRDGATQLVERRRAGELGAVVVGEIGHGRPP
jgi:hypothetical protein